MMVLRGGTTSLMIESGNLSHSHGWKEKRKRNAPLKAEADKKTPRFRSRPMRNLSSCRRAIAKNIKNFH